MKSRAFGCRSRTKFTAKQVEIMEAAFHENHYPDTTTLESIAFASDVNMDKLNVWFQNRRSKFKKQSKGKHLSWMRSQIFMSTPESEKCHVLSPPSESSVPRPSSNLHYYPRELSTLDLSMGLLRQDQQSPLPSLDDSIVIPSTNTSSITSLPPREIYIKKTSSEVQEGRSSKRESYVPLCLPLPSPVGHQSPSDEELFRYIRRRNLSADHDITRNFSNPLTLSHLMNDISTRHIADTPRMSPAFTPQSKGLPTHQVTVFTENSHYLDKSTDRFAMSNIRHNGLWDTPESERPHMCVTGQLSGLSAQFGEPREQMPYRYPMMCSNPREQPMWSATRNCPSVNNLYDQYPTR